VVVCWITVCATKNTFFSYLSMKLSCPFKLRVMEIKLAFPIPFKYSIIYGCTMATRRFALRNPSWPWYNCYITHLLDNSIQIKGGLTKMQISWFSLSGTHTHTHTQIDSSQRVHYNKNFNTATVKHMLTIRCHLLTKR